jgi:hypothetical protein
MIRIDVPQGTPEWERLRIGIPTVSSFDKIISPKKLQPSTQAETYLNQLLAEWLLDMPIDWGGASGYIDRGRHMEEEARAFYEFADNVEVAPGGFILRDDRKVGGSPDGLVGDDGGVEIKCPAMHTHIGYLRNPQSLVSEYHLQVQGYLYLTERAWWDVQSYNPVLPRVIVRVPPDEKTQTALNAALNAFVAYLDEAKEMLAPHRAQPRTEVAA